MTLRLIAFLTAGLLSVHAAPASDVAAISDWIYRTADVTSELPPPAEGMVYDLRASEWSPELQRHIDLISADTRPLAVVLLRASSDPRWFDSWSHRSHRVILLAPLGTSPAPDISVPVTAEEVSTALEAINSGVDLASLASPAIAKRRFDEAALVRHHNGETPTRSDEEEADAEADAEAPIPPDLMLQRAVQILQGLHALGRS